MGTLKGGAEKKILLHLWSLGIEEQFYLLWPILVWAGWKAGLNLWILLLISFASSFLLNITSIAHDPVSVFYHPGTRVWELLIGAIFAYLHVRNNRFLNQIQKYYANLLSSTGILLVFFGWILINKDSQFPGWWALLPTMGAAFLIASDPASWINKHILSNKILVWFGLISFPLYLWHWPLLSAAQIVNTTNVTTQITRLVLAIFSIGLAWLTFVYIEKPLKKVENSPKKFFTLIALILFCGGIGYAVFKLDGLPSRFQAPPLKIRFGENACHSADGFSGKPCEFGNLKSTKTVLIYGDSISGHLTNAINESLGSQYKFVFFGHTPCFLKQYDGSQRCESLRNELYKFRSQDIYAVIRSHSLARYGAHNAAEIKDYLLSVIAEAESFSPKKIIIAGDVQNIDTDCEFANYYIEVRKKDCEFDESSYRINKEFFKVSNELSFPKNVFFVYPHEKLCANGKCQVINDSISYYFNGTHLSTDGALLLVPDITHILGN